MESQQFTFEIDWDFGQQRGMYDFAVDPASESYYNETDDEEVEVAEEDAQEPETAQTEKPAQGQQKDIVPVKTKETVP